MIHILVCIDPSLTIFDDCWQSKEVIQGSEAIRIEFRMQSIVGVSMNLLNYIFILILHFVCL